MRISDWSSDVCSSDLFDRLAPDYSAIRKSRHTIKVMARDNVLHPQQKQFFQMALPEIFEGLTHSIADSEETIPGKEVARIAALEMREVREIGRASCRERVCQYVSISVVGVSFKKKKQQKA